MYERERESVEMWEDGLIVFNGISTFLSYLMPNPV